MKNICIEELNISERSKFLIKNGNDGTYPSRSEADMAVILDLVKHGISESTIRNIFSNYPIGEKYREHNSPEKYLEHTISNARKLSNLTEEEIHNPLFISQSLSKESNGNVKLNIVNFQEYIVKKHTIKIVENSLYQYNGKCYIKITEKKLNEICQQELKNYRKIFSQKTLKEFIHFAEGKVYMDLEEANSKQLKYLNLNNGLFDLVEKKLVPHTLEVFTTKLLPYDYNPDAKCPKFLKYLDEVFFGR